MPKRRFQTKNSGRVDKVIAIENLDLSRNQISHLINCGSILIDGIIVKKASKHVKENQNIEIDDIKIQPTKLIAEDLKLDIVYEDKYLVIVEKRNNMVVHPAPGHMSGTMVNGLMHQITDFNHINGTLRPGVVHRLDKHTTGLLVFAKNQKTAAALSELFKNRDIKREYIALARGIFKHKKGIIDAPIGRSIKDRKKMEVTSKNSKKAITHFEVIHQYDNFAMIKCILKTGRTHQIRVHMEYVGHKILGDNTYGLKKDAKNPWGQYLHASHLEFMHPNLKKIIKFNSHLPKEFSTIVAKGVSENE